MPLYRFKFEQLRRTPCLHRGSPLDLIRAFSQNNFLKIRGPDALIMFEKSRQASLLMGCRVMLCVLALAPACLAVHWVRAHSVRADIHGMEARGFLREG
jgi:hypothetical protein